MRTIELGLRPRPALFRCSGFYQRYLEEEDDAGLYQGFGIFGDIRTARRLEYIQTDKMIFGRLHIQKVCREEWKQLRLSICFGRYICDFYIRLWRIK